MALAGAFPLPSIAGDDRRGIAEEVLLEEDEDEEDESSEDESTSFEETDDDSGADARGSASGRLLPTRVRSQDPRALEVVIEAALGPNPTVSRTPSPWELDSMDDTQERFTTEHRHHANATYRDSLRDTRQFFTGALKSEIAGLDERGAAVDKYVDFELDAIRRVQQSRAVGPTRGVSPEIFPPDEPGDPVDELPARALCHLHKRAPEVTIDGGLYLGKGSRLPQHTVIEQRCLFELRMPRQRQKPNDIHQFTNVDFKTKFTFNPSGGTSATAHRFEQVVKGFYDGETHFFVRFAPHLVGFWTYKTICSNKKLNGREGRFQCVRATGRASAVEKHARVKRFAVGECKIVRPGAPVDDGLHRIMVNMDGTSRDMNYGGWNHMIEFFAFANDTPGTERFTVGQAWDPHRVLIGLGLPEGWSMLTSFYAYTTPQPGTERFAIGEAFNPHRVMINLDGTGRDMNYDGWRHKTHFYAYPNQKSHVAAIGQAQSNLWGLPHLSGLLERAFWSWAIYARNSRVVSQAEYRETALQAVEIEIAQQKSALNRLQSQEKKHEATLQQDTSEWHRTIEDTEDLLYQSCMQKTSNAKGFTKEMHEIRNQSTEHKIVGAKLRADMDALLRQQRARKAKSDAVLAERAKQRTRDAERKQQEFLEGEARKREEQRVKDSHRLEKIVAQGKGELEKFLNDTESAEAKAEAKAEAEAAGDVEANAELAPGAATTEGDTAQRQSFLIPEPPKDSGDPTSRGSRWNRAQRLFQGGLMSSPAAVDAFRRADALREARQWEGAADAYASAIRLRHAATATALNQRGVCLAEVPGRLDEAVAEYSRALELTPHLAPIWHNRGVARMTQGNLTAAAVDLQRALELAHNDDTVQLLEEVKAELASPEDAREAMREALGAYSQENYLLALSQFERALELGEVRRSRCFNGVGLCYLAENQRDLALEAFQKALEADPDNASAKHNVDVLQRG